MLIPLTALSDNYIWLYADQDKPLIVVDPSTAQPVIDYCSANNVEPMVILLTHLHADHIGGVAELKRVYPHLTVYGSSEVATLGADVVVEGGEFEISGYKVKVISTPGHTEQHVSYVIDDILFCGDTLFSAGCGRVFTGDYSAMYHSLLTLKQLPDETVVCPAHEYTVSNLKFALHVLKNKRAVEQYVTQCEQLRAQGKATLPTTIATEKVINPFFQTKNLEQFIAWRKLKDNF